MNKRQMTEDDEMYLQYLQAKHSRLDNDYSYAELNKFVKQLEREGK